jgi:ABC-2 type transport system permease protein
MYSIRAVLFMRVGSVIFLIGKLLRFSLFFILIFGLASSTKVFAGYTRNEVVFFFLTFNLVDTITQMVFREVYRFRQLVVSGELTGILIKPYHPFVRILFGGFDIFDGITLIPLFIITFFVASHLTTPFSPLTAWLLYVFFLIVSFTIAMSFHILVLSLGIMITEVDHAIMIYRDLSGLGRLPITIYQSPVRELFTYIIPVGIMMAFPVYVFLGKLGPFLLLYSVCFATIFLVFSLFLWKKALRTYQGWGG